MSVTLPAIVGQQHTIDLLYRGRRIDGTEAFNMGLCDALAAPEELRGCAHALAADIAASAPLAVQSIRRTLRGYLPDQLRSALDHELSEQRRLQLTADFAEGIQASAARRVPVFRGC